jgi:DhnA family fructose-bisphosphate aldolase class Ia
MFIDFAIRPGFPWLNVFAASKESPLTSLGKKIRLSRIVDPVSGSSVVLPIDQGVEEFFPELLDADKLMAGLVEANVNAFIARRGFASRYASAFAGRAGYIQRITGRSGLFGDQKDQLLLASVEQAVASGADAVVATIFVGGEHEARQLPLFGRLVDECERFQIPLVAEIFPAGGPDCAAYDGPYSLSELQTAVRLAGEEGADLIKTAFLPQGGEFAKVVEYSLVPVLVAGGEFGNDPLAAIRMAAGARQAGACGVAIGRKIWRSPDPAKVATAVVDVVRGGIPLDQVIARFA